MDQMNADRFHAMKKAEKVRWFFQYYGWKLLVVLMIVAVGIYFIRSVFFPQADAEVSVLVLTDELTQEMADQYEAELSKEIGQNIEILVYAESDVYGRQAFVAKVGADTIDLVIVPQHEAELLSDSGYLLSCAQIGQTDLYMGIPRTAREGEGLQKVIPFMEEQVQSAVGNR